MKYIYPAIFKKEKDGKYSVSYPDFDSAYTWGKNLEKAMYMAEDCLGLVLYGLEEDKEPFPQASSMADFKNTENEFVSLINLDLNEYKKRVDNKPVKKPLYIPKNLNDQAEEMGLNFSELLRQALKQRVARN